VCIVVETNRRRTGAISTSLYIGYDLCDHVIFRIPFRLTVLLGVPSRTTVALGILSLSRAALGLPLWTEVRPGSDITCILVDCRLHNRGSSSLSIV
jgi:hypothetical protein